MVVLVANYNLACRRPISIAIVSIGLRQWASRMLFHKDYTRAITRWRDSGRRKRYNIVIWASIMTASCTLRTVRMRMYVNRLAEWHAF